jgi:hypothetical protein
MTKSEIVKGLRRSAEVCIEKQVVDEGWTTLDVTPKDAVFMAAATMTLNPESAVGTPEHACTFLLFVAEELSCRE